MSAERSLVDLSVEIAVESIWKQRDGLQVSQPLAGRSTPDQVAGQNVACVLPIAAVVDKLAHGIRELRSPLSDS